MRAYEIKMFEIISGFSDAALKLSLILDRLVVAICNAKAEKELSEEFLRLKEEVDSALMQFTEIYILQLSEINKTERKPS